MPSREKLREQIAEIAGRPKNTECREVLRILKHLGASEPKRVRHGLLVSVPGCSTTLQLNDHNNGKDHLPSYCVKQFLLLMSELDLHE